MPSALKILHDDNELACALRVGKYEYFKEGAVIRTARELLDKNDFMYRKFVIPLDDALHQLMETEYQLIYSKATLAEVTDLRTKLFATIDTCMTKLSYRLDMQK